MGGDGAAALPGSGRGRLRPARITEIGYGYVDAHQLVDVGRLTAAELVARFPRRNGRHFWVVGMIHAVDDPEASLDEMVLGTANLIGFLGLRCVHCSARYPEQQHQRCVALNPFAG